MLHVLGEITWPSCLGPDNELGSTVNSCLRQCEVVRYDLSAIALTLILFVLIDIALKKRHIESRSGGLVLSLQKLVSEAIRNHQECQQSQPTGQCPRRSASLDVVRPESSSTGYEQ